MWAEMPCSTVVALLESVAAPHDELVGLEHALHLCGAHGSEITLLREVGNGRPVIEAFAAVDAVDAMSSACREAMSRLTSLLRLVGYPSPPTCSDGANDTIDRVFLAAFEAVIAPAVPLYGTCVICAPVTLLNSSIDR